LKDDIIVFDGTIVEVLPNYEFIVELENGFRIRAYVSGKTRKEKISILLGNKVKVEVSTYDVSRGRITWRYKNF
jgi:translation initiation factor IF-1